VFFPALDARKLLPDLPSIFALFTFAAGGASILFNYGYFLALGIPDFLGLLSITDHIISLLRDALLSTVLVVILSTIFYVLYSASQWFFVGYIVMVFVLMVTLVVMALSGLENEIESSNVISLVFAILYAGVFPIFLSTRKLSRFIELRGLRGVLHLARIFYGRKRFPEIKFKYLSKYRRRLRKNYQTSRRYHKFFQRKYRRLLIAFSGVSLSFFGGGILTALSDISSEAYVSIELTDGTALATVILIRPVSSGYIVYMPAQETALFIKLEQVISIASLDRHPLRRPNLIQALSPSSKP
jgi:hypothetical protein